MKCSCYCVAESYNMEDLALFLRDKGYEPKFYDEVIHTQIHRKTDNSYADIFYFSYGVVIFWGHEEGEDTKVIDESLPYTDEPLPSPSKDNFVYLYNSGEKTFINEEEDEISLESDDVLIKLSISHALSQSVKLIVFEESVAKTINDTRYLAKDLAKYGKVKMSRKLLAQQIGKLFAERDSINLHSDILDTPEFFWRRPKYEPLYLDASSYVDISTRVDILNKRLDVIRELYEILSNELNHVHSSRLELIVIFLIYIEVMLVILRDILRWI